MAAAGRYLSLRLRVPDRPGSLAAVLAELAAVGANVLEVEHERTDTRLHVGEVEVFVVLETRGPDHADEVVAALTRAGFAVTLRLSRRRAADEFGGGRASGLAWICTQNAVRTGREKRSGTVTGRGLACAVMTDAIVVEGLVKRFGATTALDGVDLTVAEGSVLGLLGPNGAGKTTVVRILTTLLRADAGRAEVVGPRRRARRRRGPRVDRPHRPVRRRRRVPDRVREPGDGRPALPPAQGRGPVAGRRAAGPLRPDRRRAAGRPRPTPAACAAGSTSPPR